VRDPAGRFDGLDEPCGSANLMARSREPARSVGTMPPAPRRGEPDATIGGEDAMITHFDHVTVCVRDVAAAKRFFGLLGFEEDKSTVISGEPFARYMGLSEIEALHVTLVRPGSQPRLEVQLLCYRRPEARADPNAARLDKVGFNHICFAVDDAEATVRHLRSHGVEVRGELADFHDRKLFFLTGPEGITIELAEWR
jgi:catechol 2,3-dioxygenase-like lactoylglutathione lyase family enzyme